MIPGNRLKISMSQGEAFPVLVQQGHVFYKLLPAPVKDRQQPGIFFRKCMIIFARIFKMINRNFRSYILPIRPVCMGKQGHFRTEYLP